MLKHGGHKSWPSFKASHLVWLKLQQIKMVFHGKGSMGINWNRWQACNVNHNISVLIFKFECISTSQRLCPLAVSVLIFVFSRGKSSPGGRGILQP